MLFYRICTFYLSWWLRRVNCSDIEIVVNDYDDTLRERDYLREDEIRKVVNKMSKLSNNDPVYYKTRTINLLKNAIENGVEIRINQLLKLKK